MPRLILLLCAIAGLLLGRTAAPAAAPPAISGWQAVLVAGDDAQPVFDNSVAAVDHWLLGQGVPQRNIHRLSARPSEPDVEPAAVWRVLNRIAALRPSPGEGCFVFITSHGTQDEGVWFAYGHEYLWPVSLAQALTQGGCRAVPTVVIISSCYSGAFTAGSMRAPNRIILSAARADRPSFGCQADRTYTVFDECLLAALPGGADWQVVYQRERSCVRDNESRLDVRASHPQAFFGAAVRNLPTP